MWPDAGRRWLPTWLGSHEWTATAADLPDRSANRQRVAVTTGITLSDEGSRRERARTRLMVGRLTVGSSPDRRSDLVFLRETAAEPAAGAGPGDEPRQR